MYFPLKNFGQVYFERNKIQLSVQGYTITNRLPMRVRVMHNPKFTDEQIHLFDLEAGQNKPAPTLLPGDLIQAYIKSGNQFVLAMDGFIVKEQQKSILVGAISYDDLGDVLSILLYKPIRGFKIINHFVLPVDVYYKGNRVASLDRSQPDDSSQVYFNNFNNGLDLHDELTFTIQGTKTVLSTVTLTDKYVNNVHVGVIASY